MNSKNKYPKLSVLFICRERPVAIAKEAKPIHGTLIKLTAGHSGRFLFNWYLYPLGGSIDGVKQNCVYPSAMHYSFLLRSTPQTAAPNALPGRHKVLEFRMEEFRVEMSKGFPLIFPKKSLCILLYRPPF